jgi:Tol biopolymer transport system component
MNMKRKLIIAGGVVLLILVVLFGIYTFSNPLKPNQALTIAPSTFVTQTTKLATIPWKYPKQDGSCRDISFSWTCLVDSYNPYSIQFSPAGNIVTYKIEGRNGTQMVINDMKGHIIGDRSGLELSEEYKEEVVFSPDGSTLAYLVHRDGKSAIAINEKLTEFHEAISLPDFSKDGKHLGYVVAEGYYNFHAVIDGKVGPQYEMINSKEIDGRKQYITFSDDGKHSLYYAGRNGKNYAIVDGKEIEQEKFDSNKYPEFLSKLVSSSTKQLIREDQTYDNISDPVISPDGNYVGYGAQKGRELWWIVEKINK